MILHAPLRFLRVGLTAGLLLLISASLSAAQSAAPDPAKCSYSRRTVCTSEGCQAVESQGIHLLVPPLQALRDAAAADAPVRIGRCDAKGCEQLEIPDVAGGGFLTLSAQQGAYLMKIYAGREIPEVELRPGMFTEVITTMLTTFVGYGRCDAPER